MKIESLIEALSEAKKAGTKRIVFASDEEGNSYCENVDIQSVAINTVALFPIDSG